MRTYVTEVETDIKVGGHAQFGTRTLIVGRSRTGKSTLVNGTEAAGSGRVSDVAGRATLAKDAELITLAPGGAESVFAAVRLSDGAICRWSLERGHRAVRTGPEIAFPLRAVREALLGEPDKTRKWILRNGGDFDWDDAVALVPEALRPRLRTIVWDSTTAQDSADRLVQAIDESKRRVREANARAKLKPTPPGRPPPTDKEIREAEAKLASFTDAARFAGAAARIAEIKTRLPELGRKITERERAGTALRVRLASIPPFSPITDDMRASLTVIEMLARSKACGCIICGAPAKPETFAGRAAFARGKIDAALKSDAERNEVIRRIADLDRDLAADQREQTSLAEERKRLEALAKETTPEGDPEEARKLVTDLHTLRAGWLAVRQAETESLQAEQDSLAWSQLADALSAALGTLVERARTAFEARVQAFLPSKGWTFGVDLYTDGREVLRVGLREGDQLCSALSGVEWATVTAALALATAPEDGPVVIAPEERAFDPDTLAEVCEALGSAAGAAQVVMTSPIAPSRVPEGWTIVKVGEAQPTAAFDLTAPPVDPVAPPPTPLEGQEPLRPVRVIRKSPGRPRKDGTPAQPRNAPSYVPPPSMIERGADPVPLLSDPPATPAEEKVTDLADLFK